MGFRFLGACLLYKGSIRNKITRRQHIIWFLAGQTVSFAFPCAEFARFDSLDFERLFRASAC